MGAGRRPGGGGAEPERSGGGSGSGSGSGSGGGGGGGGDSGKSAFDQLLTVFLGFKLISSINNDIKKGRPKGGLFLLL